MEEAERKNLLQSIEMSGAVEGKVKVFINTELSNVIDMSSGRKRLKPYKAALFRMILSQPLSLSRLSPFEIRCLNCNKVITYPAWHYELKFDGSILEYFVCFSEVSPSRVGFFCGANR